VRFRGATACLRTGNTGKRGTKDEFSVAAPVTCGYHASDDEVSKEALKEWLGSAMRAIITMVAGLRDAGDSLSVAHSRGSISTSWSPAAPPPGGAVGKEKRRQKAEARAAGIAVPTGTAAEAPMDSRTCGACDACCVVFRIPELGKAAGVRCIHAEGQGCAIYAGRPTPCRQFRCGWHLGYGGPNDRPDRIGILLHAVPIEPGTALAEAGFGVGIQAHELWPRALTTPGLGVDFVRRIAADQVVTILHVDGTRRVVGPDVLVERVLAALRSVGVEPRVEEPPSVPAPTVESP